MYIICYHGSDRILLSLNVVDVRTADGFHQASVGHFLLLTLEQHFVGAGAAPFIMVHNG